MKSLAVAKVKRLRAVELLADGLSYDEIAREVGFSHRGSAHRAVSRALAEREVESVDTYRSLELARLDRLQVAVWADAIAGDLPSLHAVLRIMDRRNRLLGLDRSPPATAVPDRLRGMFVSDWQ